MAASEYIYDGAGRLTGLNHMPATGANVNHAWQYDVHNRVRAYANSFDMPMLHTLNYDDNNQLIYDKNGYIDTYQYDLAGNRIYGDPLTYNPPPGNRITDDGTYTYEYDDEGNLWRKINPATDEVWDYQWDHRNRLTKVTKWSMAQPPTAPWDVEYQYDAFDRRVSRKETSYVMQEGSFGFYFPVAVGWQREKYVYDGEDVLLDFTSAEATGPFTLARRYLHGPAVDQILAQENLAEGMGDDDRVYWLLADNQNTIRDIVDRQGNAVQHYKYNGLGEILEGDTSKTRYLYTGRELDTKTGLQYNRARWLNTNTARFLSEDPIGFAAGDYNLYRYVQNNTTNATDPSGTEGIGLVRWYFRTISGAIDRGVGFATQGISYVEDLFGGAGLDTPIVAYVPNSMRGTSPLGAFIPPNAAEEGFRRGDPDFTSTGRELLGEANRIGIDAAIIGLGLSGGATSSVARQSIRSVPNPFGKLGGPAHQAKVAEVVAGIESRGLIAVEEFAVRTVNGQKVTRYIDAVAIDPRTQRVVEVHQIGKSLKSSPKIPVARERAALRDIRFSPEVRGAKRIFHSY